MIWNNWNEFFAMGGYALYVWGSMAVVVLCLVSETLLLGRRNADARALPAAQDAPAPTATGQRSSHGVQDETTA